MRTFAAGTLLLITLLASPSAPAETAERAEESVAPPPGETPAAPGAAKGEEVDASDASAKSDEAAKEAEAAVAAQLAADLAELGRLRKSAQNDSAQARTEANDDEGSRLAAGDSIPEAFFETERWALRASEDNIRYSRLGGLAGLMLDDVAAREPRRVFELAVAAAGDRAAPARLRCALFEWLTQGLDGRLGDAVLQRRLEQVCVRVVRRLQDDPQVIFYALECLCCRAEQRAMAAYMACPAFRKTYGETGRDVEAALRAAWAAGFVTPREAELTLAVGTAAAQVEVPLWTNETRCYVLSLAARPGRWLHDDTMRARLARLTWLPAYTADMSTLDRYSCLRQIVPLADGMEKPDAALRQWLAGLQAELEKKLLEREPGATDRPPR